MNDSKDGSNQNSGRSTRTRPIAKLLVILGLTALFTHLYVRDEIKEYETWRRVTENSPISGPALRTPQQVMDEIPLTAFVMFVLLLIFFGLYEGLAIIIELAIKRVIKN